MCPSYKGRTAHGRVNRRGRFDGRPNAAPLHFKQMYVRTHADTAGLRGATNGASSDLVLNNGVAYLGFGRYWQLFGR